MKRKPSLIQRALRSVLPPVVFNGLRAVATWSKSSLGSSGAYDATNPRRKILDHSRRPTRHSAQELTASLPLLRDYCRQLVRNHSTARAIRDASTALIIGTGIGLEIDTGVKDLDAKLQPEWLKWWNQCGIDGRGGDQILTQVFGDEVETGEMLCRFVMDEKRDIPLAILPLESEWLDDGTITFPAVLSSGLVQIGAIIVDKYGRPQKYIIRNPDLAYNSETVDARHIIHDFEPRRANQTRGEPCLVPVIETLEQEKTLVDTELKAAITASAIGLAVTSQYDEELDEDEDGDSEDPALHLRLGGVARLLPGDDLKAFSHDRPSQQISPFRQMLRGDIAAATRLPQRFLDRDVSRANYSSMRADMLDTERMLAPIRERVGHAFPGRCLREVMPFLCAKLGVKMPEKYGYRLIPDGQPYVDPYKDAQASAMMIASGLSTFEKEIGKRGEDRAAIWRQLAKEQLEAESLGLKIDLSGTNAPAPQSSIGVVDDAKPAANNSEQAK